MTAAPLKWAIVGTGTISRSIVEDLRLCRNLQIPVVDSRNPENAAKFAAEFDIPNVNIGLLRNPR